MRTVSNAVSKPNPVAHAIAEWLRTLAPSVRICVAYSGGIDSSVLLHALMAARSANPSFDLSAIHIHHGLSPNAEHWARHCETTCNALNLPFNIVRVRVERQAEIGIEAAARAARYDALLAHAQATNTTIALAHHARDQAETVLLQLLRGAGPAGLAAMPESSPPFARPLLDVSKEAIDAYANAHSIAHIVDESNADSRFARNRLRNTLWPSLTQAFASAERTLARAARWQHEADELAKALADIDLEHCTDQDALMASRWRALAPARRRNALRQWLAQQRIATPSSERLLEWEKQLLTENATQNVVLTHRSFAGSIRLYRDRIQYVAPGPIDISQTHADVVWRGESVLSFGGGKVFFERINQTKLDPNATVIRPIDAGERWIICPRREGDTIVLSPNSGGVSLKNVFQRCSVPPWLRAQWPVLTCNDAIAALPGLVVADAFRPSSDLVAAGECVGVRWQRPS
jgi:tRNA(Ile)-lysidine synthase